MSKLGLHINGRIDLPLLHDSRPTLLVVWNNPHALHRLHGDPAAPLAEHLLLAGVPVDGLADWDAFWTGPAGQDVDRALTLWWEAAARHVETAPAALWMGFPRFQSGDPAPYLAFEAARVERLAVAGARACVGNVSTGLPDSYDPGWADFPALASVAAAHDGVLGLREFGALYMWTGYGSNEWLEPADASDGPHGEFRLERKFPVDYRFNGDLCLHYRAVYRDLLEPVGLDRLPLVITACGPGHSAPRISAALSHDGQPTAGWRSCAATWRHRDGEHDPADFYVRQLQWYDAQIMRDPFVLGAAVYGVGAAVSPDYALTEAVLNPLLAYIDESPDVPLPDLAPVRGRVSPPGVARSVLAAQQDAPTVPEREQASSSKRYYLMVDHPEIFNALWQEGEPLAEDTAALFHWQEVGGRFIIQTDDFTLWGRLYQLGQVLVQRTGAALDGGEIDMNNPESDPPEVTTAP